MAEGTPFHWAPMSHAYVKYLDEVTGRWMIFQASGRQVNFVGETMFNSVEYIVDEFVIPVSAATKLKTIQYAQDTVGSPYGIMEIVGFGLVAIASLVGMKIKNPFASTTSFFCSQVACDVIQEIDSDNSLDPATCSPLMLRDHLVAKNYPKA
jgi:hypothetical protein